MTEAVSQLRLVAKDLVFAPDGGRRIIEGVSFVLHKNEMVVLTGENGSGKTTLLDILTGFVRPEEGRVHLRTEKGWINAGRYSAGALARNGIGRLWQEVRLFPTLSLLDNVRIATPGLKRSNPLLALVPVPSLYLSWRDATDRAMYHLDLVGLGDRAHSSCDMISVGQMRRVGLARLLQMEAALLCLDEPLAGLDSRSADALVACLGRLRAMPGKSLLVVEHRLDRLRGLYDRGWVLREGKLDESTSFG